MDTINQFFINKRLARQSFERCAQQYDQAAVLQREVASRLSERLEYIKIQPQAILDIGAGTGLCSYEVLQRYPQAHLYALDIAQPMLEVHQHKQHAQQSLLARLTNYFKPPRTHYNVGDMESLPYADSCIDLVVSNVTFQWANELDKVFAECFRVLKPGGLLMFTSFGPDTLKELRASWQQVDPDTNHVNQFIDLHDVGDALLRNRFADPVMDMDMITVTYADVMTIMRDLKHIGAHNVTAGRRRGLTGKSKLGQLKQQYEAFRVDGTLPVSYEVIYGHAWKVEAEHTDNITVQFE